MKNPGLPEKLWALLDGGLWHATRLERLIRIVDDGYIKHGIEPRYRNGYALLRGGVSLFDFGPESDDQDEQKRSNWSNWLSAHELGRVVVWLELNRTMISGYVDSPRAHLAAMRAAEAWGPRICAGVEGCHIGHIPTRAIVGAVLIYGHDIRIFRHVKAVANELREHVQTFAATLPPEPPEHPIVVARRKLRGASG